MISARIRKAFPASPPSPALVLDVEFSAEPGITALYGARGSGKTAALEAIAGFIRPDAGRILLDDAIVFDAAAQVHMPARLRRCGYVFPEPALFPHMSVRRNLEFAAHQRPRLERRRRVNEALERFQLTEAAGKKPHQLSEPQKQRAALARALIGEPKALLVDDPCRGASASLRLAFRALLLQIRSEREIPILFATSSLEDCLEVAERMLVLQEGRILQTGTPRRVVEQPASFEAARCLGLYNLLPAEIKALDPSRDSSRLKLDQVELAGPYFPGRFLGDRVWICVRPDQLVARPRDGKPGPNQMPVQLLRATELVQNVRLEFTGDVAVEMSRADFEPHRHTKEWVVEFPPGALRVL
jgi:molybdate transport system ATP-binding protein